METILIALITGLATIIAAYFGYKSGANKKDVDAAIQKQWVADEFKIINKKLDEHNHYAKKFESCDIKITDLDKKIVVLQKDIELLKEVKNGDTGSKKRK